MRRSLLSTRVAACVGRCIHNRGSRHHGTNLPAKWCEGRLKSPFAVIGSRKGQACRRVPLDDGTRGVINPLKIPGESIQGLPSPVWGRNVRDVEGWNMTKFLDYSKSAVQHYMSQKSTGGKTFDDPVKAIEWTEYRKCFDDRWGCWSWPLSPKRYTW